MIGLLLAAVSLEGAMTSALAAVCQNDIIAGLIRPEENTVPAYEIITRRHTYYKVLGPNAARAREWREADAITLCAGARQSGLVKITNKRLRKMLDAEQTPPPISPLIGTGLAR